MVNNAPNTLYVARDGRRRNDSLSTQRETQAKQNNRYLYKGQSHLRWIARRYHAGIHSGREFTSVIPLEHPRRVIELSTPGEINERSQP